jgi:hypothetical protein
MRCSTSRWRREPFGRDDAIRHYTQSLVMAWLAFDRTIALSKRFKLEGPLRRWEQIRANPR